MNIFAFFKKAISNNFCCCLRVKRDQNKNNAAKTKAPESDVDLDDVRIPYAELPAWDFCQPTP